MIASNFLMIRAGIIPSPSCSPISQWKKNSPPRVAPGTFYFNEQTNKLPALILEPVSQRNLELWKHLPVPAWSAPIESLPNAEIFLQAQMDESGKNLIPLLAGHRFGAGKALYAGFDETWKPIKKLIQPLDIHIHVTPLQKLMVLLL